MLVPTKIFTAEDLVEALNSLRAPYGLRASGDNLFGGAVFTRDSVWCSRFAIGIPDISSLVLHSTARTQGTTYSVFRDEQPGKMAHEFHDLKFPSLTAGNIARITMLIEEHGGITPGAFLRYTSIDATPLWIIALGEHCAIYGRDILQSRFVHSFGGERSIRACLLGCMDWIATTIEASELDLLDYTRQHTRSPEFHVLRDGKVSYRHDNNLPINLKGPIAYLEVQGYAYDALHAGANLLSAEEPVKVAYWRALANRVQVATLKHFWMPEVYNFAAALDRHPLTGAVRQIRMLSTVQPEFLGSSILDSLASDERAQYVECVVRDLFTSDFLTDVGVRSVSLQYDTLTGYYSYQGTRTAWPILSHLTARGLRHQGYHALANDIDTRMINGINASGVLREFVYVTPDGLVIYDPEGDYPQGEIIHATDVGENQQAWTIAAAIEAHAVIATHVQPTAFEQSLLPGGVVTTLWNYDKAVEAFNKGFRARFDLREGRALENTLADTLYTGSV